MRKHDERTEWLGSDSSRVRITMEVMRELSRTVDPHRMYRLFTEKMAALYPVSRLISLSRRGLRPGQVRVTRFNLWREEVNPWVEFDRLPLFDRGLLAELIALGEPRIIDQLELSPDDPGRDYLIGQQSLVALPLFEDGEVVNMVILSRESPGAFPDSDLPELIWIANLFGRATSSALLQQRLQETNAGVEREIARIAKLQQSLMPSQLPKVSTLDMAVHTCPTATAGGDYYQVLKLPRNRWGFLLADVCGHGPSAAMLVAVIHSLVKTFSGPTWPPGLLLSYINEHVNKSYTKPFGTFVTAIMAVYDADRGKFAWANAGHPSPRIYRRGSQHAIELKGERQVPLGVLESTEYAHSEIDLVPGDQIILFTDGLIEACVPGGDLFGIERIDRILAGGAPSARGLIGKILGDLTKHLCETKAHDDYTLLALKFIQSNKKAGELSGEWRAV